MDPRSAVGTGASEAEAAAATEEERERVKEKEVEVLSPEEQQDRRHSKEKCVKWLEGLPGKFSGMHIVQQTVYAAAAAAAATAHSSRR